ncbi:MAG: phosphate acyltransferase PlsX [Verrucomicrobia bacterium]|nr:phosphate acyltransferase PlsX [Cytophagales bacterium]
MRIAIDAMGGDFAPEAVVEGTILAQAEYPPEVEFLLIGKPEAIQPILNKYSSTPNLQIIPATEVIEMGEHPTKALSQKPNSSIAKGFGLLQQGKADAFCSAGNTGAMTVGSLFSVKAIEGIMRPSILSLVPTINNAYGVILDVGANADCKPELLDQFAEIGSIFAENLLHITNPKVGLINLGEEEQKGSLLTQAAYQQLKQNKSLNFVGNIEGRDIFTGKADVLVCDGFTGNVVLKMAESFYDMLHAKGINHPFLDKMNYEAIGGSPILGINGNVVIGHGISSPLAIKNMIMLTVRMAESNMHLKIKEAFSRQIAQ